MMNFEDVLRKYPIIAAVKSDESLEIAAMSNVKVVFILYGSILTIGEQVEKLKTHEKIVIIHIDLIHGLASKEVAIDFIMNNTNADGIISTRQNLVKYALEKGFIAGERTFLVDSMAKENIKAHLKTFSPSFLEVMPGVITRAISELVSDTKVPIVAGGLISDDEDLAMIAKSGALAVSTSNHKLWL